MALDAGTLVFVAYDRDALSSDPTEGVLGILTDAFDKEVQVEENGIGAGSFSLNLNSSQRAWCRPGNYVRAYRDAFSGQPLAGFLLDSGEDDLLSPEEEGGTVIRRTGQGGLVTLKEAIVWHRSLLGSGALVVRDKGFWRFRDSHPSRVIIRLLREAQTRGAIPHVGWDFTVDEDTDGDPWSDSATETWRIDIGQDLLSVIEDLRESGFHIEMGPNFVLHAWNDYDNDLTGSVALEAGVNIRETAGRTVIARRARSVVLMEGDFEDGETRYLPVEDEDIEAALGRRKEGYFRYGRTATRAVLRRTGRRKLRRWRKRHDGIPALGLIDTTGMVAFEDYRTSDTVEVHIPPTYDHAAQRIVSITLTEIADGTYDPTVELEELPADHEIPAIGEVTDSPGDGTNTGAPNTRPTGLDRFDRDVAPAEPTAGDPLGVTLTRYSMGKGQERYNLAAPGVFSSWGAMVPPTLTPAPTSAVPVEGIAGTVNTAYSWSPFGCGIGPGDFSGWREQEVWWELTVPTHPGSMAGIYVTIQPSTGTGVATTTVIRVHGSAPTDVRQGTVVGEAIIGVPTTVFIPGALVPAAGSSLWIGVGIGWDPDYPQDEAFCSPYYESPVFSGYRNSGRADGTTATAATWAVAGSMPDFGSAGPDGEWDWTLAGQEGSPTGSGMDGDALFVEGEGGLGIALSANDADGAPWTGAVELGFTVDASGDTGDAARAEIVVTTTSEGGRMVGTIHLGDAGSPEGVSVSGGSTEATTLKVIGVGEEWRASFETRAGEARGKVWRVLDGEPAEWDVIADLIDTEDVQETLTLWLRSQAGMTVRVTDIAYARAARSGQHVDMEWTGYAGGSSDQFTTRHRYEPGTLHTHLAGAGIGPKSEDGPGARYRVDYQPTAGMAVRATYTVA